MRFNNTGLIAHSQAKNYQWNSCVKEFSTFTNTTVPGGTLDFSIPLVYFDLSSDQAENLRRIGEAYEFNSLPISLPTFTVNIFEGLMRTMA